MRYFFFSYINSTKAYPANGFICLSCKTFPSNEKIKTKIQEAYPDIVPTITGWTEFNSKEDFDAFNSK